MDQAPKSTTQRRNRYPETSNEFWGVEKLPDKNGLMIPQMMEGLIDGKIRVFYIFGENLANTEPDIVKIKSPEGKITAG